MKHYNIPVVAAVVVQPFALYLFLRVLECGFFLSGGLAALSAALVGFTVRRVTAPIK